MPVHKHVGLEAGAVKVVRILPSFERGQSSGCAAVIHMKAKVGWSRSAAARVSAFAAAVRLDLLACLSAHDNVQITSHKRGHRGSGPFRQFARAVYHSPGCILLVDVRPLNKE